MNEPEPTFDDLQQHVHQLHVSIDRANLPPADLWASVQAQLKSETRNEENQIMSNIVAQPSVIVPSTQIHPPLRKGFRHQLSLAASLAMVLTVALGGWFATMQINQPNGQFGLFGQTDQSAACDVEPLTVDEVMEIVENPYKYSYVESQSSRLLPSNASKYIEADHAEAWMMRINNELLTGSQNSVTEDDFAAASARMDGWLACAFDGTVGQAFNFVDPFDIQRLVLSNFPVYRDPEMIRNSVQTLLEMPAPEVWGTSESAFNSEDFTVRANPTIEDAVKLDDNQAFMYNSSRVVRIGITVTNADGEVVFENLHSGLRSIDPSLPTKDGFTVLMAKSAYNGEWYVLAVLPDKA